MGTTTPCPGRDSSSRSPTTCCRTLNAACSKLQMIAGHKRNADTPEHQTDRAQRVEAGRKNHRAWTLFGGLKGRSRAGSRTKLRRRRRSGAMQAIHDTPGMGPSSLVSHRRQSLGCDFVVCTWLLISGVSSGILSQSISCTTE